MVIVTEPQASCCREEGGPGWSSAGGSAAMKTGDDSSCGSTREGHLSGAWGGGSGRFIGTGDFSAVSWSTKPNTRIKARERIDMGEAAWLAIRRHG